jgi:hypothetical protein
MTLLMLTVPVTRIIAPAPSPVKAAPLNKVEQTRLNLFNRIG